MLIIEGSDLVGKTTLAQKIIRDPRLQAAGYVYAHFTRLPDGFDRYRGYVDRASRHVVQDRFHMSEVVYAHARGDTTMRLDPERYRLVDAQLRMLGALTVVVACDEALLRERYRTKKPERAEMYDEEIVIKVNRLFFEGVEALGYHADESLVIRCTSVMPYVAEHVIDDVLSLYMRRQAALDRILRAP